MFTKHILINCGITRFEPYPEIAEEKLPRIIPEGETIQIYLWKEREGGEKLHNRYILSEVAGVMFGTGLDQARASESLETDDLTLLTRTQLDQRLIQFKSSPAAFISVADPIEITGVRWMRR